MTDCGSTFADSYVTLASMKEEISSESQRRRCLFFSSHFFVFFENPIGCASKNLYYPLCGCGCQMFVFVHLLSFWRRVGEGGG